MYIVSKDILRTYDVDDEIPSRIPWTIAPQGTNFRRWPDAMATRFKLE